MYSDGEQPVSLGETLVKAGYAKLQNWGLEMMSMNAFNLKEAERKAKQQRLAIWRNYVVPATAGLPVIDMHTCTCFNTRIWIQHVHICSCFNKCNHMPEFHLKTPEHHENMKQSKASAFWGFSFHRQLVSRLAKNHIIACKAPFTDGQDDRKHSM